MGGSEPNGARKDGVVGVPAAHGVEFLIMAQVEDQRCLINHRRIGERPRGACLPMFWSN